MNKKHTINSKKLSNLLVLMGCFSVILTSCKGDPKTEKIETDTTKEQVEEKTPDDGLLYQSSFSAIESLAKAGGTFVKDRNEKENDAISLNGTNEYVLIKNKEKINPLDEITISIWYKTVSFKGIGNNTIINKGYEEHKPPYYQYHIGVTGNKFEGGDSGSFNFTLALNDNAITIKTKKDFWQPNKWYHLVASYDGSSVKLYVNGEQVAKKKYEDGAIYDYGKDICIGKFSNFNKYTPGTFDNFRIYNRALSNKEVSQLYRR